MMPITDTVKQLLIINLILFVGSMFVPAANEYLCAYYIENPSFKFWQPITYMFMHADVFHIMFNMFGLYFFGSMLEHFWGSKKFLFFYITCGLGALIIQMGINYFQFHNALDLLVANGYDKSEIYNLLASGQYDNNWSEILSSDKLNNFLSSYFSRTLGASGAVYGLLAAFAFMFPNAELSLLILPIPIKAKIFVPLMILVDLFSGIRGPQIGGPNIAHFAHVGGALVGILLMYYWKNNQFNQNRWDK